MNQDELQELLSQNADKLLDDMCKSLYNGTSTSIEEPGTFSMADLDEAIKIIEAVPDVPEFIYARHLPPDDAYKIKTDPGFGFLTDSKVKCFVGKNVRDALIDEGIPVTEFKRRNNHDDEPEEGN